MTVRDMYGLGIGLIDNAVTWILRNLLGQLSYWLWLIGEGMDGYRIRKGYKDGMDKKYGKDDLLLMALFLPEGTPKTIKGISSKLPRLSKNHCAEVAKMANEKEKYSNIVRGKRV